MLFADDFTNLFGCFLSAAAELQKITMRLLAVGAGFSPICRIMQRVQQFFRVFSGFIEQRIILWIPNVGRRAGGIYDHGAAVATVRMIVIVVMPFPLLGRIQNHLVDLTQHLLCQTLAKIHHEGMGFSVSAAPFLHPNSHTPPE